MFNISIYSFTVPENVDDETIGTLHFADEFEKRYGPNHPQFFTGTLEEAIQEACGKPPKEVCVYFFS